MDLVEREDQLQTLRDGLAAARAGHGCALVVEAPAGQGKTALLEAARAEAEASGMPVFAATASELEREHAFGVVRQLFERVVDADLLAGAAELAAPVFTAAPGRAGADVSHARLHGLFWLCVNLAERGPLVLSVDDAHWADAPSAHFLHHLVRRLDELPIAVVIGARTQEPGAAQDVLDAIATAPAARLVVPERLSPGGVGAIATRLLGAEPDPAFVAACAASSGGNALLATELLRTLAAAGVTGTAADAEAARGAVPHSVTRLVRMRLRGMDAGTVATARALAVLGARASTARAAAIAGVERETAAAAITTLDRAGLTAGHAFAQPLLGESVLAEVPVTERDDLHRRAAQVLEADGAPAPEVAAHLLATEPGADAQAARTLLAAGRGALADGAYTIAVRLLRRALAEPPAPADRPWVLLALGEAAARSGEPDAAAHLLSAAEDREVAVHAALAGASLLSVRGEGDAARALLGRAADAPVDELEEVRLQLLPYHEQTLDDYAALLRAPEPSLARLSHLAMDRAFAGAPATEVRELARRALAGGELVRRSTDRIGYLHALGALLTVEAAHESDAGLRDALAVARRSGSRVSVGSLTYLRSSWAQRFGDLRRAVDDAEHAFELLSAAGAGAALIPARIALVAALLDRGEIERAEAVAAEHPAADRPTGFHGMHAVRARLRLTQDRPAEALAELDAMAAIQRRRGWTVAAREFSDATRVSALARLGHIEAALAVADDAIERATARGVSGARGAAHLARAELLTGEERLAELRLAVEHAGASPVPALQARAWLELGEALRRAGRRTEARQPLREARDIARRCGAGAVEERAHEELVVAGARPQRVALSGLESLTASERRVAELAAEGLRNREIAQSLYVTLKTVEVHLSRAYAKLGIQGRSQLAEALN